MICRESPTRAHDTANKKFVDKLSGEERKRLSAPISKGKVSAKTILKARILLKADQGDAGESWSDEEICCALDTNSRWSFVWEKLATDGLDAVLTRKTWETPPIEPIFDGERQAQLIAVGLLGAAGRVCAMDGPPFGGADFRARDRRERALRYGCLPLKKAKSART